MSPRRLLVEADGGSRGNPGPAGFGALVRDAETGELLTEVAGHIGRATNNVAEYRGLIAGLRAAADIDPTATVEVRMDSKLVVEQMSGRWQIKHPDMRPLALEARRVLPAVQVTYRWVPREQNRDADRLANEALDADARGEEWQARELRTPPRAPTRPDPAPRDPARRDPAAPQDPAPQGSASPTPSSPWLTWVRQLHSIAQAGLAYPESLYDVERYERVRDLAAQMMAALAGADPERLRLVLAAEEGYLTPKLDLRAAVFDAEGRVLLVREHVDGLWTLPGGWADVGESVAHGVVREVEEESGYVVAVERLLGIYDRERWGHPPMPFFTIKIVLGCRVLGGEVRTSHEIDEVGWFGRDGVPPLSETRCSPRLLQRMFEHHDDPTLPPDLD